MKNIAFSCYQLEPITDTIVDGMVIQPVLTTISLQIQQADAGAHKKVEFNAKNGLKPSELIMDTGIEKTEICFPFPDI